MPVHPFGNPTFRRPDDLQIWRFIDLRKYVDLLDSRTLWLSRADRLGDPFEGSISQADKAWLLEVLGNDDTLATDRLPRFHKLRRTWMYVNCWHLSEHENAALWTLHATDSGVALVSTYARLRDSLQTDKELYIGAVEYRDYGNELVDDSNNWYGPYFKKRREFSHERELRLVLAGELPPRDPGVHVLDHDASVQGGPLGVRIRVDLERLISEVRVSPLVDEPTMLLYDSLARRYEVSVPVVASSLTSDPTW